MGLINNLIPKLKKKNVHPYLDLLKDDMQRADHPYYLAVNSFENLKETSSTQDEFFLFMIEDILSSSLYATFYEELIKTIHENKKLSHALIEAFSNDEEKREQVIAEQSQYHLNFLLNDGHCDGCPVCNNHQDVEEIIPHLKAANLSFFQNLYLGMQTIQFAMEELIFDMIPQNQDWTNSLDQKCIVELRKEIFEYAEKLNS
jgi:hypothetical protein